MSTKLVVSIDGLLISNFNTVVSNRSIDEVILVGTSTQFNNISDTDLTSVITKKDASNFTLSVAFPDSTSTESINSDFYNWLQENSISFFNDPSLLSLSSSLILTSSSDDVLSTIESNNIVKIMLINEGKPKPNKPKNKEEKNVYITNEKLYYRLRISSK